MHIHKDLYRDAVPVILPAALPGPLSGATAGVAQAPAIAPAGRSGLYRAHLKRIFDVTTIVVCAPLVVPVLVLLALLVAAGGGKPFYRQARVGRGGHIYTMWKLRTMVHDADAALADHLAACPAARAEWRRTQKLRNDPRITPVGAFLRKTSLDELPQLINVLRGEMSLVGPRPMLPEQQGLYPGTAYYKMRPGITGFWQVSARNETAFAERAYFDSHYDHALSFGADLRTLLATVQVVTRATGH